MRIFGGPFFRWRWFFNVELCPISTRVFFLCVGGSLINGKDQTSTLKIDQYSVEKWPMGVNFQQDSIPNDTPARRSWLIATIVFGNKTKQVNLRKYILKNTPNTRAFYFQWRHSHNVCVQMIPFYLEQCFPQLWEKVHDLKQVCVGECE